MKDAILQAVARSGPIRCHIPKERPHAFQLKADLFKRQTSLFKDPVAFILRSMVKQSTAHAVAPYLLAIMQLRPDLKIPDVQLFKDALVLLDQSGCNKVASHADAPVSPGYDIIPASDQARKDQVAHNNKIGKSYQGTKSVRTKNPHKRPLFSLELGY